MNFSNGSSLHTIHAEEWGRNMSQVRQLKTSRAKKYAIFILHRLQLRRAHQRVIFTILV